MAKITLETNTYDVAGIAVDLEFASKLFESGGFAEARAKIDAIRAALDCFDCLIIQRQQERKARISKSDIERLIVKPNIDFSKT